MRESRRQIAIARGTEACDRLLALGYRGEWRQYSMSHAVCAEEIADPSAWLRKSPLRPLAP